VRTGNTSWRPFSSCVLTSNSPPLKAPDNPCQSHDAQGNDAYILNPTRSLNNMRLKAANAFILRVSPFDIGSKYLNINEFKVCLGFCAPQLPILA
jgi:hypothetical protein